MVASSWLVLRTMLTESAAMLSSCWMKLPPHWTGSGLRWWAESRTNWMPFCQRGRGWWTVWRWSLVSWWIEGPRWRFRPSVRTTSASCRWDMIQVKCVSAEAQTEMKLPPVVDLRGGHSSSGGGAAGWGGRGRLLPPLPVWRCEERPVRGQGEDGWHPDWRGPTQKLQRVPGVQRVLWVPYIFRVVSGCRWGVGLKPQSTCSETTMFLLVKMLNTTRGHHNHILTCLRPCRWNSHVVFCYYLAVTFSLFMFPLFFLGLASKHAVILCNNIIVNNNNSDDNNDDERCTQHPLNSLKVVDWEKVFFTAKTKVKMKRMQERHQQSGSIYAICAVFSHKISGFTKQSYDFVVLTFA